MPIDQNAAPDGNLRRWEFIFSTLVFILALGYQATISWRALPLDRSGTEETLQAITIRTLASDGMQLNYPVPVLGYPWSLPNEFGVHLNLSATVMRATGWPAETSGRSVALFFFYLGLPAIYLIARSLGTSTGGALLALVFWLLSPFGRIHSTHLGGMTTALAFSLWWLWFSLQTFRQPATWNRLGATLTGIAAAVCGPFVWAPLLLAGALLVPLEYRRQPLAKGFAVNLILTLALPLGAAAFWIVHTDGLKAANAYASFLSFLPVLSSAVGNWSDRFNKDFWMVSGGNALGSLISPLAILILIVFSASEFVRQKAVIGRLALAGLVALLVFVPSYNNQPSELAPLGVCSVLILACLTSGLFQFSAASPWLRMATALLIVASQLVLENQGASESPNQTPTSRDLALAVAAITTPSDVVITSGQGWDPAFAYWDNRRSILIPAGKETQLELLDQAFGQSRDLRCGAVVLTGRYRSETTYIAELRKRFALANQPIIQSGSSDVYVPASADAVAHERLANSKYAALAYHEAPPPQMQAAPPPPKNTPEEPKIDPFSMMSPRPSRSVVPYDLTAHTLDGVPHFFAHAPTVLEFDLPTGASGMKLEFFMAEGSYTGKGDTDGTEIIASVRHVDGKLEEVFRRALKPVENFSDRGLVTASVPVRAEKGAVIVLQTLPGPDGHANFDWVYFRRVEIK